MNYYEKHIGDYIRDTVSLTMLEDGAYNRLMDQYYQTERPLPADRKMVYRLARATSTPERKAVDFVLQEYFDLTEEGYTQKRIQSVIEAYWDRDQGNAVKKEHDRDRQKRSRERRKALFEELRGHGIVPEFNTPTKELSALLSRVTERDADRDNHASVTRDNTATQTPLPNPQSPDKEQTTSQSPPLEAPDADAVTSGDFPDARLTGGMAGALRRLNVTVTSQNPILLAWIAEGFTVDEVVEAVELARVQKPQPQAIPPAYLDRIVRNQREQKAAPPKPAKQPPWWLSESTINAKGRELGLEARPGESRDEFKARITERMAQQQGAAA
jgi:uncharacterized protein YdaU (DUF1376 family)